MTRNATSPATATVGDYVIEAELGRGAFGVVYRAHHADRPDTPVALKVVHGQGNTDRLLLEPAVLSRLDHPCIVGLEDYFLYGDDLALVLEYVDGVDLKELLEAGHRFDDADVRDLLVQVGSALAAAHARSVLHRDVKPANILVARGAGGACRFVLTDFGIGQVREGIQRERQAGGTFLFMAPEQLRGRPGPQSDLWALGVVAYRLLTGVLPFPGPTVGELTSQILYAVAVPPSEALGRAVDPALERAVLRLLDKSLAERTASAEALLAELGHRGPAGSLPAATRRQSKAPAAGRTLDQEIATGLRWYGTALALCVLLYLLPAGVFAGVLSLVGLALFFTGQRGGNLWGADAVAFTLAAYLCLAGSLAFRYVIPPIDYGVVSNLDHLIRLLTTGPVGRFLNSALGWHYGWVAPVAAIGLVLAYFALPAVAGACFAQMRRLQRERLLRDLARQGDVSSERYLAALRDALESRYEDVGMHLSYAEALYARGRIDEAAAEARLVLRQDPYNFNGNLLLANAYLALGLHRECVELCDGYLAVSGYCFEFADLRAACARRDGP